MDFEQERAAVEALHHARSTLLAEVGKVIVGQHQVVDELILCLLTGGHCLITGAPGLAKTLLVKTLADLFHLSFRRIQFTPDLMPSDITGTEILEETAEGRQLMFQPGPLFANMILADEINRTPPKTQAALLEAMQERQITVGGETLLLPQPFFVLATQNPIEMEGTYALPEAQLDRFLLNVVVRYLTEEEEVQVVQRTTSGHSAQVSPLFTAEELMTFQQVVRRVPCASDVVRYAVRLSAASRPGESTALPFVKDWVNWGAGTRASQSLILASKARALLSGRSHVGYEDVDAVAPPVMRHRILLNYRAEAEGITVDHIISRLLQSVAKGA